MYVTFHEQKKCGYNYMIFHHYLWPQWSVISGCVGMIFKHKWRSHECLKNILTHQLRHTWPKAVMGNYTHTSVVHGKSVHKGFIRWLINGYIYIPVSIFIFEKNANLLIVFHVHKKCKKSKSKMFFEFCVGPLDTEKHGMRIVTWLYNLCTY